ncbi:MAG: NAD(P)-dependent alcohol dehydrogenase [Eubacteriales bacterium]|nr:NAD(P)-dependent alcohol dehydrogenase [Eubacteriales bacterium]
MQESMRKQLEISLPVDPDSVLIQVEYVGVCGSDVHYFHDGRCGSFEIEQDRDIPFMLGHECAGTVVEVGTNVTHLAVGDRVCCEPSVTCSKCEFCKSGHYNLCENVVFWATPPVQGCYMKYVPFKADLCYRLPETMSSRAGALIEPFATGMYAAEKGEITVGSTVVILGSGCIGLMTMLACKAKGASQIIVCDLEDVRLDKARELGATSVINSSKEDPAEKIRLLTGGRGPDVVFETAGSKYTIAQTAHIARRGGTVVLVGMSAEEEITYNFGQVMSKELTLKSLFRYVNMFPKSIAAAAQGLAPVEKIATHEYTLENIQQAFEDSINKKNEVVKAIIRFE